MYFARVCATLGYKLTKGGGAVRWLAVDYGDARTGLAVCDAAETIAAPVTPQIEEKSLNRCAERAAAAAAAQGAASHSAWPMPPACPWCCGTSAVPP